MPGIFVYSDNNALAAELIGFGRKAGQEVNVIVFSSEAAEQLQNRGADKIYVLNGDSPIAENYGQAVAEFLKNQEAVLFAVGATARGRDLAAQAAGYLDCGMASDVSSVSFTNGEVVTERLMYGGAVVVQESLTGLAVVTIPYGNFTAIEGQAEIINADVQADQRVSLVDTAPIVKQGADLSAAEKVVCVGMGMDNEEDLKIVQDLAAALGAEIGCSRGIAEERHWLPSEQYIGISGATIKPQLYLAMGVSGQVQHTIGIRDAKIIVAVNNNEKSPIFKACDYGIVGDMYEVIPLLTEALSK